MTYMIMIYIMSIVAYSTFRVYHLRYFNSDEKIIFSISHSEYPIKHKICHIGYFSIKKTIPITFYRAFTMSNRNF